MTESSGETLRLKVEDVVWRDVDGELVVLELSAATYLTLNGSARLLWLTLTDGSTVEGLTSMLTDRYKISKETAKSDVELFLSDLKGRDLLLGSDS